MNSLMEKYILKSAIRQKNVYAYHLEYSANLPWRYDESKNDSIPEVAHTGHSLVDLAAGPLLSALR